MKGEIIVRNKKSQSATVNPSRLWKHVKKWGILIVAAPIMLLFIYRLPFIHPISTFMLKDIIMFKDYDRRWIPLKEISPILRHSVMMSEDGQFCNHWGIDWRQLYVSILNGASSKKIRGASTITMQMVRNLFLWNSRSFIRKMIELPIAFFAELILPKSRIMEIYLNIAEWGPGIYGVEAAAHHYFKRSASQISARQAAYLSIVLPNPIIRHPKRLTQTLKRVAHIIESRANRAKPHVRCIE